MPRADCDHRRHPNPYRNHQCVKCGFVYPPDYKEPFSQPKVIEQNGATLRPRRIALEQDILKQMAGADGYDESLAISLWRHANTRVKPGDIYIRNREPEIDKSLADLFNNTIWSMELVYDDYLAGDANAADRFERYGRMLRKIMGVWRERHVGRA